MKIYPLIAQELTYHKISIFFLFMFVSIICCVSTSHMAYADKALVTLKFRFANIAVTNHKQPLLFKAENRYEKPREEANKIYYWLRNQTSFQRKIDMEWHIINYQFLDDWYSKDVGAYHLFDISWYRFSMMSQYKEKGVWGSRTFSPATGFHIPKSSPATVKGFGEVPVSSSSYSIPVSVELLDVEKLVRTENYRIIVARLPITQPFLIFFEEDELKKKKWEILGEAKAGHSSLYTVRSPFFYPFDEYIFNIKYKSYYPADVSIWVESREDLDISIDMPIKFFVNKNKNEEIPITFFRDNKLRKILWPMISSFFPLLIILFRKKAERGIIRLLFYVSGLLVLAFVLPSPLNVPRLNIMNIFASLIFLTMIVLIEFKNRRKLGSISEVKEGDENHISNRDSIDDNKN